jgi:hypothetical protein
MLLEQEKTKAISDFFYKKHFIHDMLKVLVFIASTGTIHSLINKFVNWLKCYFQNLAKKRKKDWGKFHYLIIDEMLMVHCTLFKKTFQITKAKILTTSTFWFIKYYVLYNFFL